MNFLNTTFVPGWFSITAEMSHIRLELLILMMISVLCEACERSSNYLQIKVRRDNYQSPNACAQPAQTLGTVVGRPCCPFVQWS
jgi:hypothetical protein